MPSVSEQLKAARESQKLSVTQVAEMTQIRSDHIRAIDQGNFDVFSAPVYIRGFVRTYAIALKLNPQEIIAQLNQELAGATSAAQAEYQTQAPSFLDSVMFHLSTSGRRLILPAVAVGLVACAAFAGYSAWKSYQSRNPLDGLSPGVYQPPSPPAGETLPLPRH